MKEYLLGPGYQYIYLDELTLYEEQMYLFAIGRLRSTEGIPLAIRSGTNPGNNGHEWVFKRWAPWLDPESEVQARPCQVLHFVRDDAGQEHVVPRGTTDSISRTFIPAKVEDNPSLDQGYRRILSELDPVTAAQQRDGNWLIKPGKGLFYKRGWFDIVDASPARATRWRYWDLGATADGGDWTIGVKVARPLDDQFRGLWFVEDVKRARMGPGDVMNLIVETAEEDGEGVSIGLPEDPGQAGKFQFSEYAKALVGYNVRPLRETGDKITRQKPVSAQAFQRNILLLRGKWNEPFLRELEAFPEGDHDDDVDGLAGAFRMHLGKHEHPGIGARGGRRRSGVSGGGF